MNPGHIMTRKIFWKKSLDQLEPEDFSGMKAEEGSGSYGSTSHGNKSHNRDRNFYSQVLRLQTTLELL